MIEIENKPQVKMIDWFNDHWYKIENEKGETDFLKSVTSILGAAPKPWLGQWRGQVGNWEANRVMNEAAEKGSRVHHAISIYLNGGLIIYNPAKVPAYTQEEIQDFFTAQNGNCYVLQNQQEHLELYRFSQWFKEVNPVCVASEMTVFSLKHKFAGTTDIVFDIFEGKYNINGSKPITLPTGRYIADIKTGSESDDHVKQIAAYASAVEETEGWTIDGGLIIYTDASTKGNIPGIKTVYYSKEELKEGFEAFLKVKAVDDLYSTMKPKIFELPSLIKIGGDND